MFAYCNNDSVNKSDPNGYWGADIHYGKIKKNNYKTKTYKNNAKQYPSYDGTYEWATRLEINEACAKIIAKACNDVDSKYSPLVIISSLYMSYHFGSGNYNNDARIERATIHMKDAVTQYNRAKSDKERKNALTTLGYGLHALQDFYAHGSFYPVQNKNTIFGWTIKIVKVHSAEYDNPFYDWKNSNKNSFTALGRTPGNRYYETRDATVYYLILFLISINNQNYVLS